MSLQLLTSTVSELPFVLREQILGYADSVRQALPEIFRESGVRPTPELLDQVIYIAGIRKFHGLVASNYWALDNSASLLLASDVSRIRMGAQDFSRGGNVHTMLKNALEALESVLDRQGASELIELRYTDLIQRLAADGSQQNTRGD